MSNLDLKQLIDPFKTSMIELEDMKSVLNKIPLSRRKMCHKIFHHYIFTSKSFKLPVPIFVKLLKESKTSRKLNQTTTVRQNRAGVSNAMLNTVRGLSRERNFIRYDKNFLEKLKPSQESLHGTISRTRTHKIKIKEVLHENWKDTLRSNTPSKNSDIVHKLDTKGACLRLNHSFLNSNL